MIGLLVIVVTVTRGNVEKAASDGTAGRAGEPGSDMYPGPRDVVAGDGFIASPTEGGVDLGNGETEELTPVGGNAGEHQSESGGSIIRHPSDTPEPVVVMREQAWELVMNNPDLADVSIIPTLVTYVQYPDAEVKWAGETAITVIAISGNAYTSGLRAAVRDTASLTNTLFANVDYNLLDQLDRQVRMQAVEAIRHLYLDMPGASIEQLVVTRYFVETNLDVRRAIVGVLCDHRYSSQGAIDVLTDAAQDADPFISGNAAFCLAEISP